MKILVVRGKNLASLAGFFEVDFCAPPLDRAGLIAITGPTGAGKTTLLDAMCLALFDRTPRFANRGGVLIGSAAEDPSGGLRASDVRGILRHGAVEAWAEVEFLGIDDRRWRARWEVRRARSRADGRIQAQQMQLIDPLDGSVVFGDRKNDTLAAIEARLGLDFDQFRRSVLLAQGEFAAFLEASGGERAELLERMTGTWLYRELGRGAFERAKQAERELELVEREREQLHILTAEDRDALEQAIASRRAHRTELERRRIEADAALRWHERAAELERALAQARENLAAFEGERAQLEQDERLLAQVERAAAVRERLVSRDRSRREQDERRRDLGFVEGELPLLLEQINQLRARLVQHEQGLERAREQRRRLAPDLDRARWLDTQIEAGAGERRRTQAKLEQARVAEASFVSQLGALEAGLADAHERLATADRWLEAHVQLGPLAEHWVHYKSLIQQQLRGLEQHAASSRRVAELGPVRDRLEREVADASATRDGLRVRRRNAQSRLRKLERELATLPSLVELRRRQDALDRCRERASRLRSVLERRERIAGVELELGRERTGQIIERDHRAAERRRVELELAQTETRYAEARRALRELEAVRDLAEHRHELESGRPCPLCGATEHPAAAEPAPVDAAIAGQRQRVEQLSQRRDELQREQGEHQGREQLASTRLAEIAKRLRELAGEHEQLQQEWTTALADGVLLPRDEQPPEADADADEPNAGDEQLSLLGSGGALEVPAKLDEANVGPALWSIEEQLDHRNTALARARAEVETLLDRQRDRQARWQEAGQAYEDAGLELDRLARERDRVAREFDEAEARLATLGQEIEARWSELDDVGPAALACLDGATAEGDLAAAFRRALHELGPELLTRFELAVQRHASHQHARTQALEGTRTLDTRRAELRSTIASRREAALAHEAELAELAAVLDGFTRERASLLGGRAVADVVRELEAAVELADRDREASKDALAQAEREHQAQRIRAHALAEQVAALQAACDEAERAVTRATAEVGLEPETLAALLDRAELWTETWQPQARRRIEQLRAELERRRAIVGERERVCSDHTAAGPPALARALAEARLTELAEQSEALRRELFELEHQLRRDIEHRTQAEALAPRLQAARHDARIWGRLRDAIGSATGDKFQKFAQSLTLELLLTQANAQLRDLKPRYALARVPGHDLELQLVDHDLGDEVRSIRGLSGGEKFLVSLALALALASLSAEDCRIDSLFIDEGFGTLDAQSLDVAVSTLDTLQGEGRQIGVISHVPGLAERVGVEIRVEPVSSGRSRVRVVGTIPV